MKKKILAIMLISAMTMSLMACGNYSTEDSDVTLSLRMSHPRADGSTVDVAVKEFVENVEKGDSSIEINVFPAAQLGDYTTVQELVGIGEDVHLQLATLGTSIDKYLGVCSAPYICNNWEEAEAIFAKGSTFTDTIAEHLEDQNIKLLAVYPMYFGGMILNKEPVEPTDLDIHEGHKVRCQQMKGPELVTNMLGYNATPMALSDCFTSLQTGVIDGMIGSGAEGYYSDYRDIAEYYLPYNDHFEAWYLIMSLNVWEDMTESQQNAIQKAADKLEADRWKTAPVLMEDYEQKLEDYGVKIIEFTDEEIATFSETCQKEVWPKLTELYGQEVVNLIAELKADFK